MKKRMITVLIAMAFLGSSLFLSSCAKKATTQVSEVPPEQPQVQQMEDEAAKARADEEARRRAEEEARMKAEEEARRRQMMAAEDEAFARQLRMFESQHIYFAFDKSDLTAESQALLKEKANWLRSNSSYSVRIDGHCDERGTNEYNLALGERRAHAAKQFLMDLGINGDRISTVSYGEERPADPRHNEEAWALNRRDEFKLVK